ncbi:LOXL4 [Branchiostoma lanceolatum]|uniref:LOXL4 protein n=1 Tax=Branchiostoma lanceolatum TaxID=7740 RepID=A0A8K0EHQ7_BRALA|nr:LOXL4 [Branchiostoma lanceolatum]
MSSKGVGIAPSLAKWVSAGHGRVTDKTWATILGGVVLFSVAVNVCLFFTIGRIHQKVFLLEMQQENLNGRYGQDTNFKEKHLKHLISELTSSSQGRRIEKRSHWLTSYSEGAHPREKRSGWLTGSDEIRIVNPGTGATDTDEGVVEVRKFGFWGRICDKDWGMGEASVVCRQLGYPGALDFYRKAEKKFGIGPWTANRWLSDVQCAGNEATLAECTLNTGIGVCASRRRWSAGVKCRDHDDCVSAPCKNEGTCIDGAKNYTCQCAPGWGGQNCSEDAMTPHSEITVSNEKFTHWEEMEEPNSHFVLENGDLMVTEEGHYLIYGQVGVANDKYDTTFKYSILVHGTPFLTCESSAGGSPPQYTCYTAGVHYLRRDDVISLMMECDRCQVTTAEDSTFFGVIKLSANLALS